MKPETIKQAHANWARMIMPSDAPPIQRQEMERAFYSGALVAFEILVNQCAALPNHEAPRALEAFHLEASDYFVTLSKIPAKGVGES